VEFSDVAPSVVHHTLTTITGFRVNFFISRELPPFVASAGEAGYHPVISMQKQLGIRARPQIHQVLAFCDAIPSLQVLANRQVFGCGMVAIKEPYSRVIVK
jgi:hypothetical protein